MFGKTNDSAILTLTTKMSLIEQHLSHISDSFERTNVILENHAGNIDTSLSCINESMAKVSEQVCDNHGSGESGLMWVLRMINDSLERMQSEITMKQNNKEIK